MYLGLELKGGNRCIIKEYFPYKLVLRDLDHQNVLCRRISWKERYEQSRANFLHEGEILKGFKHPNIVKYVDHFLENNTGYIITVYCKGPTLDKYIEREREISITGFLINIIIPLINVLQQLHKQGIIHRDIKPNNIIINKEGKPIIIDFGSAIHYQRSETKKIFVTPGFSPLEFYSETAKQGCYSDIYSFAATLYYYLCGKAPTAASERVIEDHIEDIRCYNTIISGAFSSAIMKNLSLDYRKRYASLFLLRYCVYLEYLILKMKRAG